MADQEHEHGTMDYSDQEKTFNGFVKFTTYTVVGIIVFLIFLALVNG
ncbi:MAG: aa3-type cytochrome c oxidase subunit IV [Pseudomonadota bacterium]